MLNRFDLFGLCPAALPQASLAAAVARAGGSGVLDLQYGVDAELAALRWSQLLACTEARIGLRCAPEQAAMVASLLMPQRDRAFDLMLAAAAAAEQAAAITLLRAAHPGLRIWVEITDAEAFVALDHAVDGYIALGHEAGGWVGEDTSFILLQKLHGRSARPLLLRGGIGLRAAAACRVAGAAGVVLDDVLLLLRESALPVDAQAALARLNGVECKLLGEALGQNCRVYAPPASAALKTAEAEDRDAEGGQLERAEWRRRSQARLGWALKEQLLPLGQGIGLAATYRDQFGTVAALMQAMRRDSARAVNQARDLAFLDEGGPLAASHGTRFPLVQGPMTRVSDVPDFAVEVAKSGALPLLALALLRGPQVREMLEQTRDRIGDRPWGVGMLGFVPQALREEQCAEIWKCPPPFALIAGGRPDQAAAFEARGIQTYIHAPAPALLRLYLEQGARRFVFEGRECGGHVGPLASFALWEQMIEVLLTEVPKGAEKDVHVLFAGGIHDALSCAMVAAITAPLAARGMKVGALMGTAYLFTREIVATGAIVQGFQDEALRCQRTVNLETGPGHASRCVDTAFAREFFETRKQLIREGRSAEEIRDALEDLNLGRLRIASKGLNRSADGQIVQIDPQRQLAEGMYMIGQVATLRAEPVRLEDLHLDVCRGAQLQLEAVAAPRPERAAPQPSDIAIVGIGTLLPKADGPDAYWHNILHQVRTIGPVPPKRWDPELYFDPDRKTRDKVYSRWGGFLDEVPFDPMRYGIPPKSMKSIDPMQLLTLEVAQRTLADAGYGDGQFDRENTSIILGAGGGLGDLGLQYGVRAELPRFVENPDPRVWERLPEWTEESFAGTLLNVAAGRVANRMDFGGVNFTVDAACGSSLAAITLAVQELETGRSNVVLAGGIDTVQSPFGFLCFSKTQALSPDGDPRTFDQSANGIAISEGLAVVALKRLADAERDGDRIYAVIKACAGSSDGKALGLTAPRPDGQIRALHRAYAKAGFSPATLELFEAHGTGTPVGDRAEAETVTRALQAEHAAPKSVVLGSVKTLIGHTKASAGVAGLIKIALSLYHRVQPAHYGVKAPIAPLAGDAAPACLLQAPRPWVAHPEHPRRAGVSAFGFGGTNFHAVLEEYTGFGGGGGEAAAGHRHWPVELMLFRARDAADLQQQIDRLLPSLVAPGRLDLSSLSFALAREAARRGEQPLSLALVASQFKSFATDLQNVRAHLVDGTALPPGLRLNRQTVVRQEGLAFLFPGQGAQYPQMGREVALYCEELRQSLEQADRVLQGRLPRRLSQYILPPAAFDAATEQAQAAALTDTRVAQPAIGAVALGYLALAERLGLDARATAGHSYGEYVALCAAGALEREDCLQLSAVRGAAMADAARLTAPGSMAAVQAARAAVEAAIAGLDGVQVANHNAPQQTVISGAVDAVATALERLGTAGHRVVKLPVSGAFHTPLVAPARAPLSAAIAATTFRTPRRAVYSNRSGAAYPADPATLKAELDEHLLSSVEFVREITALYEAGCRTFIELGPKSLCTNMAKAILEGRDGVLCVALDGQGGGLKGLLLGLAELWTQGVAFDPLRLFDGRRLDRLDLAQLARAAAVAPLPAHTWMISGGCARPLDDPQRRTGRLPALTQRDVESARAAAAAEKAQAAPAAPLAAPAPAATAASATPAAGSAAPLWNGPALAAYQQTMQQFLALQERVMQQAFGLAPATAAMPLPAVPSVATVAPPPTAAMVPVSLAAPAPAAALPSTPPATTVATAVAPPAQVRVVPPRPSPTPTIDWRQTLLDLVAERTGYPPDMLALDADLEADLGVDSIKRVEILGALQKALPGEAGSAVQAQMERFTQARSLQAILDTLAELTSSLPQGGREAGREGRAQQGTGLSDTTATSAAPTPSPAPAGHPLPLAGEGIKNLLLDLVAERTGYPPEMLALDADLEADLGVDSIKRVEILGALQKALPGDAGGAVKAQMERFTQARSLQAILDTLAELTSSLPQGGREAGREGRAQHGTGLSDTTATSATPTPSPAPAGHPLPLAGEGINTLLLDLVAERTGYPPEMLALDADLEADLGVDSIKRVEILGALQKALPADAGEAVKAQMERFTQARSLQAILDTLAELTSSLPQGGREAGREGRAQHGTGLSDTTATSATPTPSPAPAGHPLPLAGEGINTLLLDLVAERTGYPPEMLALDADLEADLGVDSIKRVEILGALQKALPADAGEAVKAQMERFTQARSLQAILDALAGIAKPEASVVTRTVPTSAAPPSEAPSPAPTPRYVLHPVPAPLPPTPKTLEGTVLLLGGPASVQEPLSAALKARGLQPLSLPTEDARALRATLEQAASARSPITGLLHLSGLEFGEPADLGDWRTGYHVHLLTLLHALQALGPAAASLRLRVASRLGGSFGRASIGHGPVLAGGLNGMLNCLRHEYPQMSARAVDFDGQTDEWIAEALLRELAVDDVHPEVGYLGEERLASETRLSPLTESPFPPHPEPDGDWVVLATGGARGITAEILIGLARPGMRLVLVGRTPEPAAESAEHAAAPTPAALRALLLAEARAQGVAVKPVEVERQLQRRLAEREIRDSLARLRAVGATVDYISCDVRDEAALRGLLHGLYERHGRIDAVLHGAGVIEDKRLPDKTPDSFERVLGTKLDAAYVLAQALQPASLKLLCFFTSVAGRYGNQGQSDYAAANEVLNRLAWTLHRRWPETRVMAINWGPWDAGMASEGVKAQFRAQGIEPIPIASGVRFFLEELARGPRKDVELVAGRGTWGVEAVPPPPSEAPPADLPLIRQAPRMGPGGAMTVDHVFTAQSDPYLLDHRIDGKLVLPAAGAAEWMAQMAAAAWPGWQVSEIRDLRQFNGISLEVDGERAIQLRARSSTHSDAGTQSITVEMVDPGQKRPCYRATVCLSQQLEPAPTMSVSALDGALAVPVAEAYGRYLFHGPRFHLLRSVDGVALAGGDATVSRSRVADWLGREGRWLFDPGLLDLPPQLAIVWSRSQHDMTALPSGFGRIQRYAGADLSQPLRLHLRLQDGSGTTLRYDAWLLDAQGRVHLAIENAEGAMSAALNRLAENRAHEHG